jgi:putative ABC transport system substrate-binding protein
VRRRDLLVLISSSTALRSLSALAQQTGKMWLIGFLAHGPVRSYEALFERLRELGYVEGQNITIERRYAEGRAERFQEFAKELLQRKADLIVVVTTPAALAVMKESATVPIVHPAAIDPVGVGLIDNLAHPGKNLTGGSILHAELTAKRLELLREMLPGLGRVAVLWNAANSANAAAWARTQDAARTLGVMVQSYAVRDLKDLDVAFVNISQEHPDGLLVIEDALTFQGRKQIVDFAIENHLPSSFVGREAVEAGGLMSYGARLSEMYRKAAEVVDKIFKGTNPADIPMEQPTRLELYINLKTAKALRLEVPQSLLARADEVIE